MATVVLSLTSDESYWTSIRRASQILREGGLVAFPTETVYGVAASAEIGTAVVRLRSVKGRGEQVPLTVHIGRRSEAALFVNALPMFGKRLIERLWPGPLTLIVGVSDPGKTAIAQGKDEGFVNRVFYDGTVGIRCPDCAPALEMLGQASCVVVASSANRTGQPPPTTANEVARNLGDEVDLILDGGPARYAQPSTIVRVHENRINLVRLGVLDERTIRRLLVTHVLLVCTGNTCRSPMAERLLKSMLAERLGCSVADIEDRGYHIRSAGTAASDGAPATPEAIEVMRERNIDISSHRSASLTQEAIRQAQMILVMTESHLERVGSLVRGAEERCRLVGGEINIEDPIGGSTDVYRNCRDQIALGLEARVAEILA